MPTKVLRYRPRLDVSWKRLEIESDGLELTPDGPVRDRDDKPQVAERGERGAEAPADGAGKYPQLIRVAPSASAMADVLIGGCPQTTRCNGAPLINGVMVLNDRDSVIVASARGDRRACEYFYCCEDRPEIVAFQPETESLMACGRCTAPLEPGDHAVRCPQCGVWHHQTDDQPCWTYAEECGNCHVQPTSLDTGPVWTPDEL